jgi:dTDP-4-dehydrorhamnose 3,5-epimerase
MLRYDGTKDSHELREASPLHFVQTNLSFSHLRGTLRGLHLQLPPSREGKLIRCIRGAVWDVAVDLRVRSLTRGQWFALELSESNHRQIWLPPGFAHGFQTLKDKSELLYQHTDVHRPELDVGVIHNDPQLAIPWPLKQKAVSPRDLDLPGLAEFGWWDDRRADH